MSTDTTGVIDTPDFTDALVGEGRAPVLDLSAARAMAAANAALGFDTPPAAQAVIDAADAAVAAKPPSRRSGKTTVPFIDPADVVPDVAGAPQE